MSEGEQTYGSISLIGRGAPAPGAVRLDRDKISWKKTGGGRAVDVGAAVESTPGFADTKFADDFNASKELPADKSNANIL